MRYLILHQNEMSRGAYGTILFPEKLQKVIAPCSHTFNMQWHIAAVSIFIHT